MLRTFGSLLLALGMFQVAFAGVGDPQVGTNHAWYAGELDCSTFPRLFAAQAAQYERVTKTPVATDEQKALASWHWRNTHYFHGEEGKENLFAAGFGQGPDSSTREYWTGLFAHGYGLCGTTHAQWTAEMQHLLGHNRGRCVGVSGHNSFEAFLTGGVYGSGQWALLDHDISTVIFRPNGSGLLGLAEIQRDWKRLTDRNFQPEKQQGWLVSGLHPGDGETYQAYNVAEYFAGYCGPSPRVHLRRGESLRRYLQPGLEDGRTFVYWGRNYNTAGVPGPERSRTWVNQPEKMHGSKTGTPHVDGQARFGNAVYTYRPDFQGDYREALVSETDREVVLEFQTPYIIGVTPATNDAWGIYAPGGTNGLVLHGDATCPVTISVDRGRTWQAGGPFRDGLDLTDHAKGHRQYWLRLECGASHLRDRKVIITTVCQANAATMPRLVEGETLVRCQATHTAIVSAGPNLAQAQPHVVDGAFDTPRVTLELATPRGESIVAVHAVAHVRSSSPPDANVKYQIEASFDGGKSWQPVVKDWSITRRGQEPPDFWSQSFCYGDLPVTEKNATRAQVRFHNSGGKKYARAEMHLLYAVPRRDDLRVAFAWRNAQGDQTAEHVFVAEPTPAEPWKLAAGSQPLTRWVEFSVNERGE